MQAVQYSEFSQDSSTAKIVTVPKPSASAGFVVVKVHAAAINPIDNMVMKGYVKEFWPMTFPFTMGYDFAGTVEAVDAADADGPFAVGDEVFAVNWGVARHDSEGEPVGGAFAEYIRIPIRKLSKKPAGISFSQAAALALVGTTAYQTVVDIAQVTAGTKVLILGGPTAVGSIAVQIAKARGAYVVTTSSTRNLDAVKTLGADRIIDYKQEKWEDAADVKGFDAVIDVPGEPEALDRARKNGTLKEDGCFVTISNFAVGFDPTAYPPLRYGAMYGLKNEPAHQDELAAMMAAGTLKLSIAAEFPFTQEGVHALIKAIESGASQGKNVLKIVA